MHHVLASLALNTPVHHVFSSQFGLLSKGTYMYRHDEADRS
jgi:hypothetical protein